MTLGSKVKARTYATPTPTAAYTPKSWTGPMELVNRVKKPRAVVSEVRKVAKLARVLMNSEMDEYVVREIKVPVVSSLGIKAVI